MPISELPVANVDELLGFLVGTRWKLLSPSSTPAQDPVNEFNFRAPTDDPDRPTTLPKMNYDERWDRPVFTGQSKTGDVRFIGKPRSVWLKEECLTIHSHPVEWVDAFLPMYKRTNRSTRATPHHLSVDQLCKWSNEKVALMQMGTKSCYPLFKPFTTKEFEQYLYLIFLNGLHPSPQIEWKLQQEHKDPIHSSGFLLRVLGNNAT